MDFLDPELKKKQRIRLMIGYMLVGILILTSSLILVFQAYGFDVDRKTGQVIQNGLVYVDSAPDGADLYINGALHKDRTNTKMTLPEGVYNLQIKKDGYRDWQRTVTVHGGTVERITYPLLLLANLSPRQIAVYGVTPPQITTQSPDRKWLMVSKPKSHLDYTMYDFGKLNGEPGQEVPAAIDLTFPDSLFKPADAKATESFQPIEWSTDNRHFLLKHTYGSGSEFIVLDRQAPEKSININQTLGINPTSVTLRDKKFDQWYLYIKDGGVLESADVKKTVTPIARNVVAYKTHDSTVVLYAQKATKTTNNIYLLQNGRTSLLRTVPVGGVKLDIARFDGSWFAAVATDKDRRTYVYKNPYDNLPKDNSMKPVPISILHASGTIEDLEFSTNTRFIMARSAANVGVYDNELDDSYQFKITDPLDKGSSIEWMDGHRLLYRSGGIVSMVDFDGSNNQKLLSVNQGNSVFFDRDYTVMYTFNQFQAKTPTTVLSATDLRTEADK